jgi:uncharacterized phiE125 gp8 family phage protein
MSLKLKTPPATEPVTLAEAKAYLDIEVTDTVDDALLTGIISALREKCEAFTGRALITQTWTLRFDFFPTRQKKGAPLEGFHQVPVDHFDEPVEVIKISKVPLLSVTHLKTFDSANVETVFDASNYFVDVHSEPGRIGLNQGSTWPVGLRRMNAVEIEFISGYGDASAVPQSIKQGMLLWIKLLMANKSKLFESDDNSSNSLSELNLKEVPPQIMAFWSPYRNIKL